MTALPRRIDRSRSSLQLEIPVFILQLPLQSLNLETDVQESAQYYATYRVGEGLQVLIMTGLR